MLFREQQAVATLDAGRDRHLEGPCTASGQRKPPPIAPGAKVPGPPIEIAKALDGRIAANHDDF